MYGRYSHYVICIITCIQETIVINLITLVIVSQLNYTNFTEISRVEGIKKFKFSEEWV